MGLITPSTAVRTIRTAVGSTGGAAQAPAMAARQSAPRHSVRTMMTRASGAAPVRRNTMMPLVLRRELHVNSQGTKQARDEYSTGTQMGQDYDGLTHVIGGAGSSDHDPSEWLGMGLFQSDGGQQERINDALRELCAAHEAGDDQIHLSGFSRGAGTTLALAQHINAKGLVHPDTGKVHAPPGTPIHSMMLLDAVPHMNEGHMTVFHEGKFQNVPYEHPAASVPPNVKLYRHYLAGAEQREQFRQAHIPAGPGTDAKHIILPNAVHSDVGGKPGWNEDVRALVLSDSTLARHNAYPDQFGTKGVLSAAEHNARLAKLKNTAPNPGIMGRAMGLVTGTAPRTFHPDAKEMAPRSEVLESALAMPAGFEKGTSNDRH